MKLDALMTLEQARDIIRPKAEEWAKEAGVELSQQTLDALARRAVENSGHRGFGVGLKQMAEQIFR